ncbi:MAG: hypothetical protein JSS54_05830 [Proteobacteria bacterium]|nr:hypothetical protein [Pseudomonadota bacterium]
MQTMSSGMPTRVEQERRAIDIAYGPDRARFKRIDTIETGTTTTLRCRRHL